MTKNADADTYEAADDVPHEPAVKSVTFGSGRDAVTLNIPRKWKRFKFMRRLNANDMTGALEVVFGEEAVEKLDELLLTEEEFEQGIETVAKALGGVSVGNS